jgi:signal peptidase I
MDDALRSLWQFFLDFVETIVIALAIFVIVYRFLFQPHQVKGNSMMNNFYDGEYVLTDKITYRFRLPARGEVIVFKAPKNEDYDYIKRIIALPGDRVKVEGGQVYLNNQKLDESVYLHQDSYTQAGYFSQEGTEILVPAESYYVLGDNRNHSSDSREWGVVPKDNIIGRAWIRYWPLNQFGVIKNQAKTGLLPSPVFGVNLQFFPAYL